MPQSNFFFFSDIFNFSFILYWGRLQKCYSCYCIDAVQAQMEQLLICGLALLVEVDQEKCLLFTHCTFTTYTEVRSSKPKSSSLFTSYFYSKTVRLWYCVQSNWYRYMDNGRPPLFSLSSDVQDFPRSLSEGKLKLVTEFVGASRQLFSCMTISSR